MKRDNYFVYHQNWDEWRAIENSRMWDADEAAEYAAEYWIEACDYGLCNEFAVKYKGSITYHQVGMQMVPEFHSRELREGPDLNYLKKCVTEMEEASQEGA